MALTQAGIAMHRTAAQAEMTFRLTPKLAGVAPFDASDKADAQA